MTPTNTSTILRQMNASGGCGWGLIDDSISDDDVSASIHAKRVLDALNRYRTALQSIGRPATVAEIAETAQASRSSTNYFIKAHPEWFRRIEQEYRGQKTYLIELRNLDEVAK